MMNRKYALLVLVPVLFLSVVGLVTSQTRIQAPINLIPGEIQVVEPPTLDVVAPVDTNYPPYLEIIPDVHIVAGRPWQMQFKASDPNNERVYFEFKSGPDLASQGATLRQNNTSGVATLSWTPALEDVGLASLVEIKVRDRAGAYQWRAFKVTVDPADVSEVISVPIIIGSQGGRPNQSYDFKALSYSNQSSPLEFNFLVTPPGQSSPIDYGWQSTDTLNLNLTATGVYDIKVSARSHRDQSIVAGPISKKFTLVNSGLTLSPRASNLEIVGRDQLRLSFYSQPLNRGLISHYILSLRSSPLTSRPPHQQITIRVPDTNNEAVVYSQTINLADVPNWQRIIDINGLITTIDAVKIDGTTERFSTDGFSLTHLFPEILSTAVSGIGNHSALISAAVSNPGGFYDPRARLYENNAVILTNTDGRFSLTDLLPNHTYANYSVKAFNPSLGSESVSVAVPTFRTGFNNCDNCWRELNDGQPVDAGEVLWSTGMFGLFHRWVDGALNGQGDYIYLFDSISLGTVAGRLRLRGDDSLASGTWELFTKNGWSGANNALARTIGDGLFSYRSMSLHPDPSNPRGEGVFGVSSGNSAGGVLFPYSSEIFDTHGLSANLIFNGREWLNWLGGQAYDSRHIRSLIPSWNSAEGSFTMGSNNTGILVGLTGYQLRNDFESQLTATRYSWPGNGQLWNLWNNQTRTWTNGNHLPWSEGPTNSAVASTFVLEPNPNAAIEGFKTPLVVYLGNNNYLTTFGYFQRGNEARTVISAALYDDIVRRWSWWGDNGWQVGGSYNYQGIVNGPGDYYGAQGSQLVSSNVGQADFFYIKNGHLISSHYQHNTVDTPASWSPEVDLGSAINFRVVAGPDHATWVFYYPDYHNVSLRIRSAAGVWSAPENIYFSTNEQIAVLGADFIGSTPLVFVSKDAGQGARLYALTYDSLAGNAGSQSGPVSRRQNALAVVNLDTRRVRLSSERSQERAFGGGLAIDNDGYIYSPDALNFTVRVGQWSDFVNRQTHQWGRFWDIFHFPGAAAVYNAGAKVYVSDQMVLGGAGELLDTSQISVLDLDKRIRNLGLCHYVDCQDPNWDGTYQPLRFGSGLGYVFGLAVDELRALLYVSNTLNHQVQVYDISGETPSLVRSFGRLGSGTGQFNLPKGLAVDPDGNLYVSDSGNHRIQKFDPEGNHILSWGSNGRNATELLYPDNIAADPTYNLLYVVDQFNRILKVFDRAGNFIYAWNQWREGSEVANLFSVGGVVADGQGRVYLSIGRSLHKFEIVSPDIDEDGNNIPDSLENGAITARFNPSGTLRLVDDDTDDNDDDTTTNDDQNNNSGGGGPSGRPRSTNTPSQQPLVVQLMLRLIELLRQLLALLLAART